MPYQTSPRGWPLLRYPDAPDLDVYTRAQGDAFDDLEARTGTVEAAVLGPDGSAVARRIFTVTTQQAIPANTVTRITGWVGDTALGDTPTDTGIELLQGGTGVVSIASGHGGMYYVDLGYLSPAGSSQIAYAAVRVNGTSRFGPARTSGAEQHYQYASRWLRLAAGDTLDVAVKLMTATNWPLTQGLAQTLSADPASATNRAQFGLARVSA